MTSEASLTVPGELEQIARIRSWLGDVLVSWTVSVQAASDLCLAVTEICTNIVRHGYGTERGGEIEIGLSRELRTLRVTIVDTAAPFWPGGVSTPLPQTLAEGGYGLGLVHSVVDGVSFERVAGGQNRTVLVKHEDGPPGEASSHAACGPS
jgi:sigma-B regulation protein RsbU (phosphoserine phosphatase)